MHFVFFFDIDIQTYLLPSSTTKARQPKPDAEGDVLNAGGGTQVGHWASILSL